MDGRGQNVSDLNIYVVTLGGGEFVRVALSQKGIFLANLTVYVQFKTDSSSLPEMF
jgi:hypothetical protein